MKKLLTMLVLLILGLGVGGGAGYAATLLLAPPAPAEKTAEPEKPIAFVNVGKVLAPLVFKDGQLTGYVDFELQVEVDEDKQDFVTARLPLLLHAINMRTYKAPMASGPDGMLPDLGAFRKIVMECAPEAFGKGVVHRVAITQAVPA